MLKFANPFSMVNQKEKKYCGNIKIVSNLLILLNFATIEAAVINYVIKNSVWLNITTKATIIIIIYFK